MKNKILGTFFNPFMAENQNWITFPHSKDLDVIISPYTWAYYPDNWYENIQNKKYYSLTVSKHFHTDWSQTILESMKHVEYYPIKRVISSKHTSRFLYLSRRSFWSVSTLFCTLSFSSSNFASDWKQGTDNIFSFYFNIQNSNYSSWKLVKNQMWL